MCYFIAKEFHFSASHQLDHLPSEHQCARLHGHNYTVQVELGREGLDGDGFVMDYGDLAFFKDYIDRRLDHRHLNDVLGSGKATTAENLARHLADVFEQLYPPLDVPGVFLVAVRVSETPKTWAEWRPS